MKGCENHSHLSFVCRKNPFDSHHKNGHKLVRHFDQDDRQTDAAVHWESIRPVLLKAFADKGAHEFSEQEWIQLFHQGSKKVRFEYCENSHKSLAYLRAIQGHTGRMIIAPELMRHVLLPDKWKEFIYHKGCSFNMNSILEHGLIARGKD